MPPATELWERAGPALEQACNLLTSPSPEHLDRCSDLLEHLAVILPHMKSAVWDRETAFRDAERLHRLTKLAGFLLKTAAAYYANRAVMVGCMAAGYAAGGRPGAYVAPGALWLKA